MQYTPNDKLGGDLHQPNRDSDSIPNGVADPIHDLGVAAMETGKAAIREVQAKTDEVTKDVATLYADGAAILRKRVASQPIAAIGIALAAGAVIAALTFRK
ncbi:MAG: hypothetical protein ABL957_10160 [Parvularculaceae bacterium]